MKNLKHTFKCSLLGVLLIVLFASVCFAEETKSEEFRPTGLHGDFSVSTIIDPVGHYGDHHWVKAINVLPGKIDLTAGYQINPYISLNATFWDFWIFVNGIEFGPKINLLDEPISPYIVAGVGVAGILSEGGGYADFGGGIDFYFSNHFGLFVQAKYYVPLENTNIGAVAPEAGIRLMF